MAGSPNQKYCLNVKGVPSYDVTDIKSHIPPYS